jgi:hypothetical protein
MNALDRLFRDIDKQDQWADELARRPAHHKQEPLDSQRHLLYQDDKSND